MMLDHTVTPLILTSLALVVAYGSWALCKRMHAESLIRLLCLVVATTGAAVLAVLVWDSTGWYLGAPVTISGFGVMLLASAAIVFISQELYVSRVWGVRRPWSNEWKPNWSIIDENVRDQFSTRDATARRDIRRAGRRRRVGRI